MFLGSWIRNSKRSSIFDNSIEQSCTSLKCTKSTYIYWIQFLTGKRIKNAFNEPKCSSNLTNLQMFLGIQDPSFFRVCVFHFVHLHLVVLHSGRLWFGHLPFWSSSILAVSILVVFLFLLSSIYSLHKSSSWVECRKRSFLDTQPMKRINFGEGYCHCYCLSLLRGEN